MRWEGIAMKEMNNRKNGTMKKVLSLTFVMMLALAGQAQVFIFDEDGSNRAGNTSDINTIIPFHNVEYDQENDYIPLGSGVLALAGLGFGYLLAKKRKQD